MATNNNLGDFLTSVANAIRTKTGGTSPINAQDFSTEIVNLPSGSELDKTITFDVDGSTYATIGLNDGNAIIKNPFLPTKSGYVFVDWALTSGGSAITYPFTPLEDTTLYPLWSQRFRMTVSGLGSSTPSNVLFTLNEGAFPTFEEVVISGDTFIKIPTMYKKFNTITSDQIVSFTIANYQADNTYQPYSCFLDESGNLLPYILIGKYWSNSSSSMISVQNTSASSYTIANARTYARNRGTGYLLYDWQIHQLWRDLIICAKRTINTNSGTAWTTDELGIYWGTSGCWVDGLVYNNGSVVFSYQPSKYIDSPTSSSDSYNVASYTMPSGDGNITKLGYDSTHPFVNMPSSASGSSYTTYYCDAYYSGTTNNRPFFALVGSAGANYGAFRSTFYDHWTYAGACRLCLRPIA